MKKIFRFPWYPIFFSLYPALSLLAHNISQIQYTASIRSLLVSCMGTILLIVVLRLIYRDWHRAAFVAAAWVLLLFSYGQVFDAINGKWKPADLANWLLGIWAGLFILVVILGGLRRIHF